MTRSLPTTTTFTIYADGPDGRVPHFYAETDQHRMEVVPKADYDRQGIALERLLRYAESGDYRRLSAWAREGLGWRGKYRFIDPDTLEPLS